MFGIVFVTHLICAGVLARCSNTYSAPMQNDCNGFDCIIVGCPSGQFRWSDGVCADICTQDGYEYIQDKHLCVKVASIDNANCIGRLKV